MRFWFHPGNMKSVVALLSAEGRGGEGGLCTTVCTLYTVQCVKCTVCRMCILKEESVSPTSPLFTRHHYQSFPEDSNISSTSHFFRWNSFFHTFTSVSNQSPHLQWSSQVILCL